MDQTANADVEVIMREKYPLLPFIQAAASIEESQLRAGHISSTESSSTPSARAMKAEAEAYRAHLVSLPALERGKLAAVSRSRLAARAAAEQAKKDATRFYNQPSAKADFEFWCKAEYWTPDEAAALLLGRDPRIVKPETLTAELNPPKGLFSFTKPPAPSEFHRQYEGLRALISRASNLQGAALTPRAALEWAASAKAVTAPPALVAALQDVSSEGGTVESPSMPPAKLPSKAGGTPIRWSPEMLERLRAVRDEKGAKVASEEFGISEARVRQLLPRSKPDRPETGAFGAIVHRLR